MNGKYILWMWIDIHRSVQFSYNAWHRAEKMIMCGTVVRNEIPTTLERLIHIQFNVQFIICDIMSEQLIEETAQFSQVFTSDIGRCKKLYFSPINCAVSSVNCSVKFILIKYRHPSPIVLRWVRKKIPSVLHWGLPKFAGIVEPTMSHLQFKSLSVFYSVLCSDKLHS